MDYCQLKGLEYLTFSIFNGEVVHGIFTRAGGVSPAPWDSLNTGGTVGDPRENVIANRQRIFTAMRLDVESIFDVWQVHSDDIIIANAPRPLNQPHEKADAILTQCPDVSLFMRFADCVPILLYDPVDQVVGLVHAGWMGTVNKIAMKTIKVMQENLGCHPENIFAGIGPSIGVDHYVIREDVAEKVRESFGARAKEVLTTHNQAVYFDLWEANRILLNDAGVKSIEIAGECTACNTQRWYSHRAEDGKTGRFGALIRLKHAGSNNNSQGGPKC
ncbi:MAG: peptidoglycan editing factor PgeF [Bellilinea sp.]